MDDPVTRIQKLEYRVTRIEEELVKSNDRFIALMDMISESQQEAKEETNE